MRRHVTGFARVPAALGLSLGAIGCFTAPVDGSSLSNCEDSFDMLGYAGGPEEEVVVEAYDHARAEWTVIDEVRSSSREFAEGLHRWRIDDKVLAKRFWQAAGDDTARLRAISSGVQLPTFNDEGQDCLAEEIFEHGTGFVEAGRRCKTGNEVALHADACVGTSACDEEGAYCRTGVWTSLSDLCADMEHPYLVSSHIECDGAENICPARLGEHFCRNLIPGPFVAACGQRRGMACHAGLRCEPGLECVGSVCQEHHLLDCRRDNYGYGFVCWTPDQVGDADMFCE